MAANISGPRLIPLVRAQLSTSSLSTQPQYRTQPIEVSGGTPPCPHQSTAGNSSLSVVTLNSLYNSVHPEPFVFVRPEPVEGRNAAQDRPVEGCGIRASS